LCLVQFWIKLILTELILRELIYVGYNNAELIKQTECCLDSFDQN